MKSDDNLDRPVDHTENGSIAVITWQALPVVASQLSVDAVG